MPASRAEALSQAPAGGWCARLARSQTAPCWSVPSTFRRFGGGKPSTMRVAWSSSKSANAGTPPNRRHRLTRFGLYITWLRRAHQVGTRLHRRSRFDAVSHATYSTYWLPTPAVLYDVPCVWGP